MKWAATITVFSYAEHKRGHDRGADPLHLPRIFPPTIPARRSSCLRRGKFLYGSNRGHDSIAVFAVDRKSGRLTFVEHQSTQGRTPRHIAIDPTGRWLLAENQASDSVIVFAMDPDTGRLKPTKQSLTVGSPVCAVFAGEK